MLGHRADVWPDGYFKGKCLSAVFGTSGEDKVGWRSIETDTSIVKVHGLKKLEAVICRKCRV